MTTLRFPHLALALVGCGGMGLRHARAILEMHKRGRCEVVLAALCDPDPAKRARISDLAQEVTGQRPKEYGDITDVLADDTIEAVDLVLPTALHHVMILRALEAGKHVLVEKPLALTVAACDLVVDAVRRTNLVVAVSENYRRIPSNRTLKALISSGKLGRIDSHHSRNLAAALPPTKPGQPVNAPQWYMDRRQIGGYQVMEMAVHDVDLQQYWFGPITEVNADLTTYARDQARDANASEDLLRASLGFGTGMVSQLTLGSAMAGYEVGERVLMGESFVLDSKAWHAWQEGGLFRLDQPKEKMEALVDDWLNSLSDEAREEILPAGTWETDTFIADATEPLTYGVGLAIFDFATAVREKREPEINAETARASVAVCCAMMESAHLGQRVQVADVLSGKLRDGQKALNDFIGL